MTDYYGEGLNGLLAAQGWKVSGILNGIDTDSYNPETGTRNPTALKAFDPGTDTLEDMGFFADSNVGAMVSGAIMRYEQGKDAVLYLSGNAVIRRFSDGTEELCAYLPTSDLWGNMSGRLQLLPDGRLACVQDSTLYIRSTNPKDLPEISLTIYGGDDNEAHKKAVQLMPDVSFTSLQNKWFSSAQEMGQALVSGEDGIDIIFFDPAWIDLQNLMDKGYAVDLSLSPVLKAHIDKVYPHIKAPCVQGDKVLALPVRVTLQPMSLNSRAFAKAGLKVPETYQDICDTVIAYHQNLAEEGEYNLNLHTGSDWLKELLISTYSDYCAYNQQDAVLDTPLFRAMALALEGVPPEAVEGNTPDYSDDEEMNAFFRRPSLLTQGHIFDLRGYQYLIHAPSFDNMTSPDMFFGVKAAQDAPPVTRAIVKVMLISTKSKNLDAALRYAEAYIKSLDDMTRITLYPGQNEPVINPDFERNISSYRQEVDTLQEAYDKAEGAEKTEMESRVKLMEEMLKFQEVTSKYMASEQAIAAYRKLMETSFISTIGNSMLLNQPDLSELRQRFFGGQITLDQYIQETDAKLKLIRLENQ